MKDVLFPIETEQAGAVLIVRPLNPEITYKSCGFFYQKVKELLKDVERPRVALDLSRVNIMDSMSLGGLVAIRNHVKGRGGEMAPAAARSSVRALFEMLNLEKAFRCYDTVEEAVKGLS